MGPVMKGGLSEIMAADAIELLSEGRLRCARPRPDDRGADWRVYQPGWPFAFELQVKSAHSVNSRGWRQFSLDLADIPEDPGGWWLLAVDATAAPPGIAPVCHLIPGAAFPEWSGRSRIYHFATRPSGPRGSKWDRYRVGLFDLGERAVECLAEVAAACGRSLPAPPLRGITAPLKGQVFEDAVAFLLSVGSDGKLGTFGPRQDTVGADLGVASLDGTTTVLAQAKGAFVKEDEAMVRASVDARTFRARADRYVVVGAYVLPELRVGRAIWAIRADIFASLAARAGGKLHFFGSPKAGSRDKWVPYRWAPEELWKVFAAAVEAKARGRQRLPAKRGDVQRVLGGIRSTSGVGGSR